MIIHKVRSQSDEEKIYTVEVHDTFVICDCESFKFRKKCKHANYIINKHYKAK